MFKALYIKDLFPPTILQERVVAARTAEDDPEQIRAQLLPIESGDTVGGGQDHRVSYERPATNVDPGAGAWGLSIQRCVPRPV